MVLCSISLFVLWLYLIASCNGEGAASISGTGSTAVGSPCSPPLGFLRLPCNTLNVVSTSSQSLPVNINGVNVCEVNRVFQVQVYEYRYRQHCGWDYNRQYRYYYWNCRSAWGISMQLHDGAHLFHHRQYISSTIQYTYYHIMHYVRVYRLECAPSGVCSQSTRLDSRTQRECCEGFAPAKPVQYNQFNPFHYFYIPENTQPSGCPLARGSTLLECMEIHGLTIFTDLIRQAGLTHLVNSTDSMVTVFAPPNEALEGMTPVDEESIQRFVQSHIVMKPIDANMLYHSTQLEALSSATLYVTLIEHYYYRPLLSRQQQQSYKGYGNPYTYQNYHNNQNNFILLRTDRYITGNLITEADACVIDQGDLHLIESFIPLTNQSVADVIASNPNLSMFNTALDILNIKTFLTATTTPHTVFAPSNTAFEDFPMILIECLSQFDREPLNNLILFHIAEQVHYLSSLSQEKWLYTRLLRHMVIDVNDNGQVTLGDDDVLISTPNIPASDGVVHIIDDLIFPDKFNYGDCMSFIGSGMEFMDN